MRRRSSAIALWLVAVAATAQQKPEEKPAGLRGIVTNALTGAPILRAHVMCDGFTAGNSQQFGALTDAEGKFSIDNLPPGNYSVSVERAGFVRHGVSVTLRPDTKPEVKLKLTPTGAILGRVSDPDGNPVENARVFAEGANFGSRTATVSTDHKGHYRIGGLDPGRYRVRASPMVLPFPPEIRTDRSEESRYVTTYHPSGPDRKSGTRIDVRSGADLTGVDIRLLRAPLVRITGIVTGGTAGTVQIEARNETMSGPSTMAAEGKFELWNLDPGKWLISAVQHAPQQLRSAAVEIEIGTQHIDNIELRLIAPFDVTGQVVFEDESAKPGRPSAGPPQARIALQEVSRLGGARGIQPMVLPADGSFKFTAVPPARYRVNYSWRASIKSIRLGAVEMENNILDLTSGTGGATLTVVFGPANAELTGIVRDDKGPAAGATVILRNMALGTGSTNAAYNARTGADGAYRFTTVPSGKYLLLALDDGDTNPINDSYEDYEDVSLEVEIRDRDRLSKDLKRHPPGAR